MRLKEFIIFIIFFTIIYFSAFAIYDYIANKKAIEKSKIVNDNMLSLETFKAFAKFYQITATISEENLKKLADALKLNIIINLTPVANDNGITKDELIVVILFLEYLGLIKMRCILYGNDCTAPLSELDQNYILKYSLYFSNKYDYKTILLNAGLNSDKEIDSMCRRYLLPGVRIVDSVTYYVGDLNE